MADLDPPPPLPLRTGTHATFLAAIIDRLASADLPELARLRTRDPADPAVALLDSWATAADVLSFYTERIAVEGYLSTAVERRSLAELAALVGYRPRPGLAASAWLAYQVDPDPATSEVSVAAGSKVQSVPDPGAPASAPAPVPQIFETSTGLLARQAWNALPARAFRPMPLDTLDARCRDQLFVQGGGLGLAANDRVLVHFKLTGLSTNIAARRPRLRTVITVTEDPLTQRTTLGLAPGNCAGTAAAGIGFNRLEVFRVRAAPFGAAAPFRPPLVVPGGPVIGLADAVEDPDAQEWDLDLPLYDSGEEGGERTVLPLDAEYPRIVAGTRVVIERPDRAPLVRRVVSVDTRGTARYGITGRVTRLVLDREWFTVPTEVGAKLNLLRNISVFAQPELLVPADEPITEPVSGARVDVAADVPELPTGRSLIVTGAPAPDDLTPGGSGEVVQLLGTERHPDGGPGNAPYTTLLLATELSGRYDPATVVVFANAVDATNGETKDEPAIGSGDAAAAGQQFGLRQKPLTYVATGDEDGEAAELTIRVNGEAWHEVPQIARSGPADHHYQIVTSETGDVTLLFGDGVHGARLPSGIGNVSARYRVGLGAAGNLGPGRITQLLTRPLGVTSVLNPLPSSGGADPDTDEAIRSRAPLGVLAPDRIVGLADYTSFALARSGVGAAAAYRLAIGAREFVQVSLAGVAGAPLGADSDVVSGLAAAVHRFGDPGIVVEVAPCEPLNLVLAAGIGLQPDFAWELVQPQLLAALAATFGPPVRPIGRGIFAAEVIACLQAVPGVESVHLTRLGRTVGDTRADADAVTGLDDYVPALAARVRSEVEREPDHLSDPAQLLVARADLDGFAVLSNDTR